MNFRNTKARVAAGALAGAAVVAVAAGAAGYADSDPQAEAAPAARTVAAVSQDNVIKGSKTLSADAATKILTAAQDAAADRDVRVTVAVVDRAGNTVALLKGDGAGPQTEQSAIDKAFTAVSFGKATADLAGAAANSPSIADIAGTLLLPGGVPVTSGKSPIAGIGVGGAPDGAIDAEIAEAALAAIS